MDAVVKRTLVASALWLVGLVVFSALTGLGYAIGMWWWR